MEKCPYCSKDMLDGTLLGDRKALKWKPRDKTLLPGLWACGGLTVGSHVPTARAEARAWFCSYCRKVIIDVDNC
ncbi:PF20097 family protein [Agathobaculum sp.]|uniref:PF20097 family protein n=1 Tax=Agathobaculum sp. TaxID=2048138 RepID=UPI002A830C93|nr:PF20097 family protein [Agathobaculum sp.]MDY3618290.1 PF20097 family protein [Agathobaculum sp.]